MTCRECSGELADVGELAAKGASGQNNRRAGPLYVLTKRITVTSGTNAETPVFSLPPATAIDVFGLSPDGSATGNELARVYAVNRNVTGLIGTTRQSQWGQANQVAQIRDVPADTFSVTIDPSSTAPGTTSTFEFVAIGWGTEPTGMGPFQVTSARRGTAETTGGLEAGIPPMLLAQPGPTWQAFVGGLSTFSSSNAAGSYLNVLPTGIYNASPPGPSDGAPVVLQVDASGNLKVNMLSGSGLPAAAALGDGDANPTTVRYGADLQVFNGVSWGRAKGSLTAPGSALWMLDVLPQVQYSATQPTWTDGQVGNIQCTSRGDLKTSEFDIETVIHDLTGNSPSSATTSAGNSISGLSNYKAIAIEVSIQGATNGTLDVYIQTSADGTTWTDYVHFTQLAASAAAVKYRYVPGLANTLTTVGQGTSPALPAGAFSGGHWGDQLRVLFVAGAGTTAGASQTVKIIGVRPKP